MIYLNIFQSFLIYHLRLNYFLRSFSIHKRDSKLECSNYKPISLLSCIDKILEKITHNWLMKFLTAKKILHVEQFGFRKNFSTAPAIIDLIDCIENVFNQNKFARGGFVTFKKAFDTVDHEILLKKLWHYGIRWITGLNLISQTRFNAFQLTEFCLTYLKSIWSSKMKLELHFCCVHRHICYLFVR